MTFGFPIWLFFCETFWIFGSTYHRVYARSETLEDMGTYDVTAILLIASKSSLKCSQGYLQNAFKILLSAWKKCFAHTSFDLLMSCSMVSQHVSTWNSGKAFTFSSTKLQAMKISWLTGYHVLQSTSSGAVICSLALQTGDKYDKCIRIVGANTHNWFDIDLNKKNWLGNSVEERRDHPFSTYVNCAPLRTGTEKQQIQVKIADIRNHLIPSRFVLSECLQNFYVDFSKIWIVSTMSRWSYSTFKKCKSDACFD